MILKGKTAVITGCNRGIGKATLVAFAEEGANVFACVRRQSDEFDGFVKELENKYGVKVYKIYFDLSDETQIDRGLKEIFSYKIPIDILVNCAGIVNESRLFTMMRLEDIKKLFQVNFFAQMQITQFISRLMIRQKRGSIVNVASIAGIDGTLAELDYVSSKAAMIGATKRLAIELGQFNIRVNAVAPGATETDMLSNMSDELKNKTKSDLIMGRLGKPSEIANAIVFLASDKASYITNQVLRIDGGGCAKWYQTKVSVRWRKKWG